MNAPHPFHRLGQVAPDAFHPLVSAIAMNPMTANYPRPFHRFAARRRPVLRALVASVAALAVVTTIDAADETSPPVNLCVVVAAPAAQPTALEVVRRAVGTDAADGGLPAGSVLRVYWSKPTGLAEASGPVRIQDSALETVEAEGNAPRIALLLQTLDDHAPDGTGVTVAPVLVPAAVDYLARYAPPGAPGDATVVLALGPWTFGDPDPDPALIPTEALLAQATPRESPFGCAQAEHLAGASWFAFGAAPAGTWSPVILSAYLRHRGAAVRDAIPVAPSAEALMSAVRRAGRLTPLPATLPDRSDGRPGFLRVPVGPTPGSGAPLPTAPSAVIPREAAEALNDRLPTGADVCAGTPVVVTPLPAGVPAHGPLVASLVWYEDGPQGPQPIVADLDLWLHQDADKLDFQHLRCPGGRLSTDLTSQSRNLQSEVAEYANAGADAVLGVNVYRNDTGKPAVACLRVTWQGGVARLTLPLAGTGKQTVGGAAPPSPGNGFRICLGDLFGLRRETAIAETAAR